jgi:hypothetical protein
MKQLSTILIFIVVISACQKQPAATFTTDKTEYYAGDTIHLTNTSENGHSYIWTMPDGSKQTTENAFYVVDTSVLYEKLTFQLEAISKHQRKKTIVTKQVLAVIKPNVSESCVYVDTKYICQTARTSSKEFNPLKILSNVYGGSYTDSFVIYIDASLTDYSGIYEIKDNISDVKNHITSMRYSHTVFDYIPTGGADYNYNVFSGKMVIYQSNGYWHAILNNAQAILNTNNQIVNVSTNLLYK